MTRQKGNNMRILTALVLLSLPFTVGANELRTPWGAPSFNGTWTTATLTPLERPLSVDKPALSDSQRTQLEAEQEGRMAAIDAGPPPEGSVGGYNRAWLDPGMKMLEDGRTSLIISPSNGRIPWRPEAKAISDAQRARYGVGPFNSHTDLDTGERCLSDGVTMAPLQPYNMNFRFVQTPDYLMIYQEMYHEYRIIPLTDKITPTGAPMWLGEPNAYWQGDTLVVESNNFLDKSDYFWAWPWRAARPSLKITERFTRLDATTIDYRFIVEDPEMFTEPWTVSAPLTTDQASRGVTAGLIYEFACHEGNYALPNVLRGARLSEADAAGGE